MWALHPTYEALTWLFSRVDYWMSAYPPVKPLGLLFLTLFFIVVGGLALYAVSDEAFHAEAWTAWSYLADAGTCCTP
jgi:hypothetical protein